MDIVGSNNTASFIPKKPLVPRSNLSGSLPGVFMFLSILVFLVSVGGYFFTVYEEKAKTDDVNNLKIILQKAQDQFEPNQVVNMTRFDAKLKVAQDLLYLTKGAGATDVALHVTLQPLLKLISDNTLKSVRFTNFSYTNTDNQKIEIKMSGEAKSNGFTADYPAVAQQARQFSDTRLLTNVIVSDLNLGQNNTVVFNLTATVQPALISYTEYLNQQLQQ